MLDALVASAGSGCRKAAKDVADSSRVAPHNTASALPWKESVLHLLPGIRGGMQISVKTLTGNAQSAATPRPRQPHLGGSGVVRGVQVTTMALTALTRHTAARQDHTSSPISPSPGMLDIEVKPSPSRHVSACVSTV
ncbi:hypothetical protein BRADI_3g07943v3 [Brachypodium distachyon]|uniref:Uncharacterized protein n=1 Tax=Brachypodium distachyon TaxID=15368 RepID=A0A2K2CVW3_BRADI|nr:hypothetical protein BRADI_3g07943v3 [Brachypodium distachyon]